jgi:AraC-like DNA-binding protein
MPIMRIPLHEPVTASHMAEAFRSGLAKPGRGRLFAIADEMAAKEMEGPHWTRVPFLMCVLRGRMRLQESHGGGWWLKAGDTALFAAESNVNLLFTDQVTFLRVTFDRELTLFGVGHFIPSRQPPRQRLDNEPIERLEAHVYTRSRPRWMDELTASLIRRARNTSPCIEGGRDFTNALLWGFVQMLEERDVTAESSSDRKMREIRHFLGEHCHRPLNREVVAANFRMSPGYLTRLFREKGGTGFQQTLLELRLERARDLLLHSRLTIEEVALQSGFTSANYFAQAFRHREGISPRTWRESVNAS